MKREPLTIRKNGTILGYVDVAKIPKKGQYVLLDGTNHLIKDVTHPIALDKHAALTIIKNDGVILDV